MGMGKTIGIGVGAVAAVVVIGGLAMSNEFGVSESVTVDAPQALAYELVADIKNHEQWNPWKMKDDTMVVSYPGETVGEGAAYAWTSENSGEGVNTFTKADAPNSISTEVEFKGMGIGYGTWSFEPDGDGTKVTWAFESKIDVPVMGPWIVMVSDPSSELTKDFSTALAALKPVVEAEAKARAEAQAKAEAEAQAKAEAEAMEAETEADEAPQ